LAASFSTPGGGALQPTGRLLLVFLYALAVQVHDAETVQGKTMILFGGGAHPVIGLGLILYDTQAGLVLNRQTILGLGITVLRQRLQQLAGTAKLFRLEGGDAAGEIHIGVVHGDVRYWVRSRC
jgi:hypothetical protein